MYNALVLISLLPFAEADRQTVVLPKAETMLIAQADPGNEVPSLPIRTRVAYTPDTVTPTVTTPTVTTPTVSAPPVPPAGPPVRPPVQTTIAPPTGPPVVTAAPTALQPVETAATTHQRVTETVQDPNIVQAWGFLEVPKRNHVELAAAYQSVLMELRTEQRDAAGNIVTGPNGRPVVVPLREGMTVFQDQILGTFDDRELVHALAKTEAQLEVAIAERDKTIEIRHAELAARVAGAEASMLQATNQLHDGAITRIEILKAGLAWEQAKAQHELQDYTIREVRTKEAVVYEKEVESAKVRIELRKLIAPISGMIVKIDKAEGEWLREGDKVLEIMQLDTLRAVCKISAQYTPAMVDGKNVTVYVKGSDEQFQGKVVFAHPKIHPGDVFDVYIEVQNRPNGKYWLLQPGHEITAAIHLR